MALHGRDRWHKLNAMANDQATTPAERQTARRLLCALDRKLHDTSSTMVVSIDQTWEIALLMKVAGFHGVELDSSGSHIQLIGEPDKVEEALLTYCRMAPELERVTSLATAGWLAGHFPKASSLVDGAPSLASSELDLVRAASKTVTSRIDRHQSITQKIRPALTSTVAPDRK